MTSPWLDAAPPPDVRRLTDRQLVETWRQNRNGVLGLMAADEGMRRLARREESRVPERGEIRITL